MRNYTIMNLIQSKTGYYYRSAQKLEGYIDSKIAYKQRQLNLIDISGLYEDEISNLKLTFNTTKEEYDNYLNTTGKIFYERLFSFVLTALCYIFISSLLKDGGLIFSILSLFLDVIIIPTLLILWLRGFLHPNKGTWLANKLNTISSVIEKQTELASGNKQTPTDYSVSKNQSLDTCFYILSVLEDRNIIQLKDNKSESYKSYQKEQQKDTNGVEKVINKKDLINMLTAFVANGQSEGRKKEKNRNSIAFFSLNASTSNDELNKLLCEILVWEGKSKNPTYKTELSNGFNRNLSSIYTDLDIINQSHPHSFINEILNLKQQNIN